MVIYKSNVKKIFITKISSNQKEIILRKLNLILLIKIADNVNVNYQITSNALLLLLEMLQIQFQSIILILLIPVMDFFQTHLNTSLENYY